MDERKRVSSRAIIGRDEPLRLLEALLTAARAGEPQMVFVAGEAGVGKTRLAGALEDRARALGFHVLHGECIEFGGEDFPYAPVVAALRDLPDAWVAETLEELDDEARGELAGLLPRARIARQAGRANRFSSRYGQGRLCELVLDLVGRLTSERAPVLVVIEDVHWADRSTRDLLTFLARNLREERIAFALTYRTGELAAGHPLRLLLAELVRRPTVARLELGPLDLDEVAMQLEAIAGGPVPIALAGELHRRSGGNPFFVEELFAARRDGEAGRVPDTVAEAVSVRVRRLSVPAHHLLAIVAAGGGRAGHDVLDQVAPAAELGPALRETLDAGLLVRDRDDRGVALRHGLMGEVVYGGLVPAERTELHRQLARALAATGAPVAQLAYQWYRAGAHADALTASTEAGMDAARLHAFAEALGHFERALELWDAVAPGAGELPMDRVELLSQTAQAARFTGDRERSVALGRQALEELDHVAEPLRAARLYAQLGDYQYWDDEAALRGYRQALRSLPPRASSVRAQLLAAEGHALMGLRRWEEAGERCESALEIARVLGDERQEAIARITLGLALAFLGEHDVGEAHLRRALELPLGEHTPRGYVHLGELLRLRGDHAGALEAMLVGEKVAARLGMRGSFGHFMYVNAADDLLRLGRWDEAERRVEAAERMELAVTAVALQHAVAGHVYALRGEIERSRSHLARGLEVAGEGLPGEFVAPLHAAGAALALVEGDAAEARRQVEAAFAAIGDERDPLYTPALHSLGVRAEADAADRARALRREAEVAAARRRAEALLEDLEDVLARSTGGAAAPDTLAHRALAHAEHGRVLGRTDPEHWRLAARAWDGLQERHPAAYARFRQAEAILTAGGDRRSGAELLAVAHATALELRARPLREDVEALARRARIALAPEPVTAPEAAEELPLTRREADVLRLLADGLTNKEIAHRLFISQKTVGTHVAHIFEKLGVHNRVEATGRAQQLGVLSR